MEATTAPGGRPGARPTDATAGESAREAVETVPAPIADPAPLGLGAFALTTFVLSFFNAGLLNEAGEPVVFAIALAYGGLAQLLAGMWEFKNNNTFGATAFSSFGAFWLSLAAYALFFAETIPAENVGDAVGLYLIAWGIFTTYMLVASLRVSAAVVLVFALLAPTYFLLGIGDAVGNETVTKIGGWVGIATALAAWYASFAGVTNKTFGKVVLPVGPLK